MAFQEAGLRGFWAAVGDKHLASSIESDRLQVLVSVYPALFIVDAHFYPDIVIDSQTDFVFPLFPCHQHLGGENFDSGMCLDHDMCRWSDLLVRFGKHASESAFVLLAMLLNVFDWHFAATFCDSMPSLIEAVLRQRELAFHPVHPNCHRHKEITCKQTNPQFIRKNLCKSSDVADLTSNEIPHFAFTVKWLSDPRKLSVDYSEDLPRSAAHWSGRQASSGEQKACSVASGYRVDGRRATLSKLAIFECVRKLFMVLYPSCGIDNVKRGESQPEVIRLS